jgi:outer membrane biosynthesis protein TonB
MPPASRPAPLEPIALVMVAVVLVHVLVGLVAWTLLPLWKPSLGKAKAGTDRYWFPPSSFKEVLLKPSVAPEPPAAPSEKAAIKPSAALTPPAAVTGLLEESPLVAPSSSGMGSTATAKPTTKIITLSPVLELDDKTVPTAKLDRGPLTMMEVLKLEKQQAAEKRAVGGADMDPVLKALETALKKEWNAPPVSQVPILQRNTRVTISIGHDGSILESRLTKASGSELLDQSVLKAGEGVKKISESLPSSFPKDRYTVEVNFHIE